MSEDKKIIVEQNGQEKEVSREQLTEMQKNPDYQVEKQESAEGQEKHKVKERLYD